MKISLLVSGLLLTMVIQAQSNFSIIPMPKVVEEKEGSFKLGNKMHIVSEDASLASLVQHASQLLQEAAGVKKIINTSKIQQEQKNVVYLTLDSHAVKHEEGYVLDVTQTSISIKAKSTRGIFYGLQTLTQLIPVEGAKNIPAVHIQDEPRFSWRGMMFDNCRHMFSVDFIKRFIDQLAYHKLNKFHWHLTEDQGWRIEIKKYPRLQTVAAYRNGTQYGSNRQKDVDSIRYGGYYTQEQIKEVVSYAASKYIEVIPEIEMPGHSVAAITAYPQLACNPVSFETGKPHEVRKVWGVSKDILCAGNDTVITFLQDVLKEVMLLFPSQYIHIGGDEAPHDAWVKCHKCQKRMQEEGLKNVAELQSWFIRRMEKFINSNNKKLIGWEEIMQGGLTPNATVHSWLGVKSGLQASKMGNDVIMSPYSHLYFDGYQAEPSIEPLAIGYYTPLETVYSFEPRHPDMNDTDAKHLLGAQANLWTEFIKTESYFEYMVFPRMDALAEITWTPPAKKNYANFQKRLQTQLRRYDKLKINYRIPVPQLTATYNADSTATVSLENPAIKSVIRYEINGKKVTGKSPVYAKPLTIKKGATLHYTAFPGNGRQSSIDYFPKKIKRK